MRCQQLNHFFLVLLFSAIVCSRLRWSVSSGTTLCSTCRQNIPVQFQEHERKHKNGHYVSIGRQGHIRPWTSVFACLREKEQEERCEMTSSRLLMWMCLTEVTPAQRCDGQGLLWWDQPETTQRRCQSWGSSRAGRFATGASFSSDNHRVRLRTCDGRECPGRCWEQPHAKCCLSPSWKLMKTDSTGPALSFGSI